MVVGFREEERVAEERERRERPREGWESRLNMRSRVKQPEFVTIVARRDHTRSGPFLLTVVCHSVAFPVFNAGAALTESRPLLQPPRVRASSEKHP